MIKEKKEKRKKKEKTSLLASKKLFNPIKSQPGWRLCASCGAQMDTRHKAKVLGACARIGEPTGFSFTSTFFFLVVLPYRCLFRVLCNRKAATGKRKQERREGKDAF